MIGQQTIKTGAKGQPGPKGRGLGQVGLGGAPSSNAACMPRWATGLKPGVWLTLLLLSLGQALPVFGQSSTAVSFYQKGRQLAMVKKYDLALDFYDKALALHPRYYEALRDRAAVYGLLGDAPAAVKDLDAALRINGRDSSLYNLRGVYLYRQRKYRRAMKDFHRATRARPDSSSFHTNLATCASELGRYRTALAGYRRAIELDRSNKYAYFGYANMLTKQGRYREAIPFYEQAIMLSPYEPGFHINHGYALSAQGRYPDAVVAYTRAISLNRRLGQAYYLRGLCFYELKETKAGCVDMQQAVNLGTREGIKEMARNCRR